MGKLLILQALAAAGILGGIMEDGLIMRTSSLTHLYVRGFHLADRKAG